MNKILLTLLLSATSLFSNSMVGTWSIDETKIKASLQTSSLNSDEQRFIERFLLHVMKSIECSADHICLIPELHNSNPTTGKFTWKAQGQDYLLEGDNKQFIVKPINASSIKMIISDMSKENLEIYYNQTNTHSVTPRKTKKTKKIHTKLQYYKVYRSQLLNTYIGSLIPTPSYFYITFSKGKEYYSIQTKQETHFTFRDMKSMIKEDKKAKHLSIISSSFDMRGKHLSTPFGFNDYTTRKHIEVRSSKSEISVKRSPNYCKSITIVNATQLKCNNGVIYTLVSDTDTQTMQKVTTNNTKGHLADIDIPAEKREEKRKADEAYLEAIQEMM